jgi:hypothetical protein
MAWLRRGEAVTRFAPCDRAYHAPAAVANIAVTIKTIVLVGKPIDIFTSV